MNLQEQLDRGVKSEKLLADPVFNDAWDAVAKAIHDQWAQCPLRDLDGQHELRLMLKLLTELKQVFELAVTDGKLAAQELELRRRNVLSPKQWMGR